MAIIEYELAEDREIANMEIALRGLNLLWSATFDDSGWKMSELHSQIEHTRDMLEASIGNFKEIQKQEEYEEEKQDVDAGGYPRIGKYTKGAVRWQNNRDKHGEKSHI